MAQTPKELMYRTMVDAHNGTHPSGAVYRRLVTVETCPHTLGYDNPKPHQPEELAWWQRVLEPIHDWSCRAAELGLPSRPEDWDDLEALAWWCEDRLAEYASK
jgi:hypothetical protein